MHSDIAEMKQRAVVTGGAGFIGSHLVELLRSAGHVVSVVDDLSYGKRRFLPDGDEELHFLNSDILDVEGLKEYFAHFDPHIIYHLAAIHHIPTCEAVPEHALKVNVEGTQSVLSASRKAPSLRRIIFASSGAVYDVLDEPLTESSAVLPRDVYGVSKVCGEQLLRLHAAKMNHPCTVARIFNAVGPRETNAHLVPDILAQIKNGSRRIQLGNLEPSRTYVHVSDIAAGLVAIGAYEQIAMFDVFNVGSRENLTVRDLVTAIAGLLGQELFPVQASDRMRKVDRLTQQASIDKITSQTGWVPRRSIVEALEEAMAEAGL
jgi:UDP-glucose 4-epimerase